MYLNCDPEEVFNRFVEFKPFGDGPWPCLNPAADHYKELCVLSCKIFPGAKRDRGKPRGVFSCSCGFTYARVGPDANESDKFSYSIVQAYGESWEALLRALWDDMALNIDAIARRLGINVLTLKRRVVALGLRFPRSTPASGSNAEILSRYKLRRESRNTLLQKKKNQLLLLVAGNSQAGRSELWELAESLLLYIQRADPQWLDYHLPPPRTPFVPRRHNVNWEEEDVTFAAAVADAVAKIKSSEVPTRVSVKAISKQVGQSTRIRKYLDRMPRTGVILNSHLESREDFLVRRIKWAEEEFRKERVLPTKTAFINRAQIHRYVASGNKVVSQAMYDALSRLGYKG